MEFEIIVKSNLNVVYKKCLNDAELMEKKLEKDK